MAGVLVNYCQIYKMDLTGAISSMYYIIYFMVIMIFFIVINYFIVLKKVIFPIGASIYIKREGGDIIETGVRIRKKEENGIMKWKFFGLKRRKHSCEPYDYALMSDKKGKPYVHLMQFNDNTYLPIVPPVGDKKDFEILNADVINWGINESNSINSQYSKMGWREIAMVAAPVVMIAICVFCVIYSLDIQKQITADMLSVYSKQANSNNQPQTNQQYIQQTVSNQQNTNGVPPV